MKFSGFEDKSEFYCFGSDGNRHKIKERIPFRNEQQFGQPDKRTDYDPVFCDTFGNVVEKDTSKGHDFFSLGNVTLRRFDDEMVKRWVDGGVF